MTRFFLLPFLAAAGNGFVVVTHENESTIVMLLGALRLIGNDFQWHHHL